MCGFTGITHKNSINIYESYKKRFEVSYQFIRDRGPDHKGIWHDKNSFFLHARLSIIDIKKTSSQPCCFLILTSLRLWADPIILKFLGIEKDDK